ncbi:fructokinase-6 [Populus alba x Populus x berolinensis]|nr:fructokinase-6 [Populus alba x Populus x berolinensis]
MAALHSTAFRLGSVALSSRQELSFRRGNVKASAFSCPSSVSIPRLSFQSKALGGDGLPETKDSSLVVCFGEMLIDFVPTISGLSLADAPAFKKAPGGAPANVAVGIARLGGSSAFIGKVPL